jgi:hypothetical protein
MTTPEEAEIPVHNIGVDVATPSILNEWACPEKEDQENPLSP